MIDWQCIKNPRHSLSFVVVKLRVYYFINLHNIIFHAWVEENLQIQNMLQNLFTSHTNTIRPVFAPATVAVRTSDRNGHSHGNLYLSWICSQMDLSWATTSPRGFTSSSDFLREKPREAKVGFGSYPKYLAGFLLSASDWIINWEKDANWINFS